MTEDQRKQYEEAANEYLKTLKGREYKSLYEFAIQQKSAFILGCSHAHSKIEEAERVVNETQKEIWDEVVKVHGSNMDYEDEDDLIKDLMKRFKVTRRQGN